MFKSISNMCEFEKKIVSKEMFEKKSSKHKVILFYFYEHQVLKYLRCSSILKLCDIVLQVPLISMLIIRANIFIYAIGEIFDNINVRNYFL